MAKGWNFSEKKKDNGQLFNVIEEKLHRRAEGCLGNVQKFHTNRSQLNTTTFYHDTKYSTEYRYLVIIIITKTIYFSLVQYLHHECPNRPVQLEPFLTHTI
jgi:hypothetical protein